MSRATPMKTAFNAGELSPLMDGRVDYGKYELGAKLLRNFIPTVQGPIYRRSGFRHVSAVKTQSLFTRLVPFIVGRAASYVCEFGNQYIRFYTNEGVLLSGMSPYEIASPYLTADLNRLYFVQANDVLYICHPNYQTRRLERLTASTFQLVTVAFNFGPFQPENVTATTMAFAGSTPAVVGSTGTVGASVGMFTSADVGRTIKLRARAFSDSPQWQPATVYGPGAYVRNDGKVYQEAGSGATSGTVAPTHTFGSERDGASGVLWNYQYDNYGIVQITNIISASSVDVVVLRPVSNEVVTAVTTAWAMSEFSTPTGWPSAAAFYRGRLFYAKGQRVYGSVANDFGNFLTEEFGDVTPDLAIQVQIDSDQNNDIEWLASGDDLLIGTTGAEWMFGPQTDSEPLGPSNVRAAIQTAYGSRQVQPVRVGEDVLFVHRAGRKLRAMGYNAEVAGYDSTDLTIPAEHITVGGLSTIQYQLEPDSIVWTLRADGVLLGFTLVRDQQVFAWHAHQHGLGAIESIAVIPNPAGDADQIWCVVRGTVNSNTVRYVEFMEARFSDDDAQADAFFVDSGLTYSGAPATTISGLAHLQGQTVSILADGAVIPDQVVSGGQVVLPQAASKVHVGKKAVARLQTMRIEAGGDSGPAQGKVKRIDRVIARFYRTLGGKMGPSFDNMDRLYFRAPGMPMNNPPPLFSGDYAILWPSGYETDGYLCYEQDQPLPVTLIALMPQLVTQAR
jgi:hypothetical protein